MQSQWTEAHEPMGVIATSHVSATSRVSYEPCVLGNGGLTHG